MGKDPQDTASRVCHDKDLPVSDHGLGHRAASYTCWWHKRPTPPVLGAAWCEWNKQILVNNIYY